MVNWDQLSPVVRNILTRLKEEAQKIGDITISESKYWLMFKCHEGSFAAVNPSRRKVRVFISCNLNKIKDPKRLIKPSPSTGSWKKKFPSVFNLENLENLDYAIYLLEQSYNQICRVSKQRAVTSKAKETVSETVTHNDLLTMLREIGEILGFFARTEENTPDGIYRCDVTWRDYEAHSPIKVFEVEVSHRIDHALSSLMHAYDVWRPEGLYLIVLDERDVNRAQRLVEPYVKGAFYRISKRLRIYTYLSIKELYENLQSYKELVRDLSER